MARRTFFSFHYKPDVHRAWNVRNAWVTQDRQDAGFFDASVFESKQRTNDDSLKKFLTDGLNGSSVTAVLYGTDTAFRRWVRFEILKSFSMGKGIIAIDIHTIRDLQQCAAKPGKNPLDCLGLEVKNGVVLFKELNENKWEWSKDMPKACLSDLPYDIKDGDNKTLSKLFNSYDWFRNDGRTNMGNWIELAARSVGR